MVADWERRSSRKRRRVSERRRVFGRMRVSSNERWSPTSGSLSTDRSWSSSSQQLLQQLANLDEQQTVVPSRSDSPFGGGGRISMKIQFHITLAPDNEPLILESTAGGDSASQQARKQSAESIGEQIHERLSRQSTASTRRRHQLLAMHKHGALDSGGQVRSEEDLLRAPLPAAKEGGRESGARSSTITGGISDEATLHFLAGQQAARPALNGPGREQIYFKRDGQRFGHEFTLKLAVDRAYRCLLKVRPLIPLQGITIQGHHVPFADCSQQGAAHPPGSAPALNRCWQNQSQQAAAPAESARPGRQQRLSHALTTSNLGSAHQAAQLQQQQRGQMMRHFAASHCAPSGSHLGGQLVYMFDWSASRFESNRNKARTQLQTVLKFRNGQLLSLPLQVKFYQPECRQHLNWGSQLHFIDYECSINDMGQINVDRVKYY